MVCVCLCVPKPFNGCIVKNNGKKREAGIKLTHHLRKALQASRGEFVHLILNTLGSIHS